MSLCRSGTHPTPAISVSLGNRLSARADAIFFFNLSALERSCCDWLSDSGCESEIYSNVCEKASHSTSEAVVGENTRLLLCTRKRTLGHFYVFDMVMLSSYYALHCFVWYPCSVELFMFDLFFVMGFPCILGCPGIHSVRSGGLTEILLPLPPERRDKRHVPPLPGQ